MQKVLILANTLLQFVDSYYCTTVRILQYYYYYYYYYYLLYQKILSLH